MEIEKQDGESPAVDKSGANIYNVDIMAETLGTFEQAVLVAILRLRDDAYGRAILKEVQARLDRDVAVGAVHTTLERLERKGLVSSRLAAGTPIRAGRVRRYYSIAAAGVRSLNESRAVIDGIWKGLVWPVKGRA